MRETIATGRLVPLVVLEDPAQALPLARALQAGGLRTVEVTLRTVSAVESLRRMAAESELLIGAGTVLTRSQVEDVVRAGARYVVTPGYSSAIVEHCRELGVPVVPGVATATEIQMALEAGLELVKFFPAEASGGVSALKALSAPFAGMRFVPTGGVSADNAADYLGLPTVTAVGGSWMAPVDALGVGDFARITDLSREAVALAGAVRP